MQAKNPNLPEPQKGKLRRVRQGGQVQSRAPRPSDWNLAESARYRQRHHRHRDGGLLQQVLGSTGHKEKLPPARVKEVKQRLKVREPPQKGVEEGIKMREYQ